MNLEQEIQDFHKAQREHIEKSIATPIEDILIEKGGKPAQIGEIREFAGKKYQKGSNGWRPVKQELDKFKKEKEGNKTSTTIKEDVIKLLPKQKPQIKALTAADRNKRIDFLSKKLFNEIKDKLPKLKSGDLEITHPYLTAIENWLKEGNKFFDKEHNKQYEGSEKKINKSILKELGFELSEIQPTSYQDSKSILSHDIRVNKGYSKEEIEGKIKSLMKREFPDRLTGVKIFNFGSYTDIVMSVTRPDSTSRRDNQARAWGLS
jgi:hypothetical protein